MKTKQPILSEESLGDTSEKEIRDYEIEGSDHASREDFEGK